MGIDNPVHLIFLAAVALLVLGPKRLPEVARSLGKGIRELRDAMSEGSTGGFAHPREDEPAPAQQVVPAPQVVPVPPSEAGAVAPPPEPDPPHQVDPAEPVRSGDHAPDRRSL
jgi:sec-independent protein translocase protein TatA